MTERGGRDECSSCYYCDSALSPRHEHDHFPVSASRGGTRTVPVCLTCHDFKDRVPLGDWPATLHMIGFAELTPKARLLVAKLVSIIERYEP